MLIFRSNKFMFYRCLARHARCNTMSHLTAHRRSRFFVDVSREKPDVTPCRTSPLRRVRSSFGHAHSQDSSHKKFVEQVGASHVCGMAFGPGPGRHVCRLNESISDFEHSCCYTNFDFGTQLLNYRFCSRFLFLSKLDLPHRGNGMSLVDGR